MATMLVLTEAQEALVGGAFKAVETAIAAVDTYLTERLARFARIRADLASAQGGNRDTELIARLEADLGWLGSFQPIAGDLEFAGLMTAIDSAQAGARQITDQVLTGVRPRQDDII